MLVHSPKSIYCAFDTYPAPKGAATHIRYMADTLFKHVSPGCLYVLGGEGLPVHQQEGGREILRFSERISNLLERAIAFGLRLQDVLEAHGQNLLLAHFRDPWGGFPLLNYKHSRQRTFKTLYEVNGLPSIELLYAYPDLSSHTVDKLRAQEQFCLMHCDHIIVPAQQIKNQLLERGVAAENITVIANGAEVVQTMSKPQHAPDQYLMYSGALQQWQGVDDLLRAFALLRDYEALNLVLCLSRHNRIAKQYRKLAEKLNIQDRIQWHFGLEQQALFAWLQHATLTVAPLTDCVRNVEQGCCPLKILESMAAGVPVVASDLPVVREIMNDHEHGRLVRPGRPEMLALCIRALLDHPPVLREMGDAAKKRIQTSYTWEQACTKLKYVYDALLETVEEK